MTIETKKCTGKCGETKPVTEFYEAGVRRDESVAYHSRCKPCHNEATAARNKERYHTIPEERARKIAQAAETAKKRRTEDPEGFKAYTSAHKAVRREKGNASEWACVDECGEQAQEWALINDSESVIRTKHYRWSDDIEDYVPMYASCHRKYDAEYRLAS